MKTYKPNQTRGNGAHDRVTPRHLLVPVDFSDASLAVLEHATRLATEWDASLRIVYVVPSDDGWIQFGSEEFRDLNKSLQKQATAELQALATMLPHGIKTELEVRIGRPAEEIAAAAAETNADLIVLSTHGRTGLDRYFVGSVAEHLIRLSPCPVYLLPTRKKLGQRNGSSSLREQPEKVERA